MAGTLFDSFESLLQKAENYFLNFRIDDALDAWEQYYRITARVEYQSIIKEINTYWNSDRLSGINSLSALYRLYMEYQEKFHKQSMSGYTFGLFKKLFIGQYNKQFAQDPIQKYSIERGVFEYLSGRNDTSIEILQSILSTDVSNIEARIFLGHAYMAAHTPKEAVTILSENLFLAADKIPEDALYLSQFKFLFGKLYSEHANKDEAAWLLVFESWYRNYLVFEENAHFFRLIQQKESNERIIQVKYHASERYRHFVRCLFIADYTRHFHKKQVGLIREQENYMQKLDKELFTRYRRKRKEV